MDNEHPIRDEWEHYYKTLEAIRQAGIVNMWGAASVLIEWENYQISYELAREILLSWIVNYKELSSKYKWRK